MGYKFTYICLGISLMMNIILIIYTVKSQPVCRRAHVDSVNRMADEYGREEAIRLAAASLGLDEGLAMQENSDYDIEVIDSIQTYEWIVTFIPKDLDGNERRIGIRRDIGIITYY